MSVSTSSNTKDSNEQEICARLAGALHRLVPRQLRRAWRAAARRLRSAAQSFPQGKRGAELLPADDPRAHLSLWRFHLDLRARRRGEALAWSRDSLWHRGCLPDESTALAHLLRRAANAGRDGCEAESVRRHAGANP